MDKSNEIGIHITKALVTEVNIDLSDGEKPKYYVKGVLTTDQGKKVSEFVFFNDTWASSDKRIEIPVEIHMHAAEIFRALKPIVYRKLNDEWPQLERVAHQKDVVEGETVVEEKKEDGLPF